MKDKEPQSRSFILAILAVPIGVSVAVACGTSLTLPAPTAPASLAAQSQAPATTLQSPSPAPTVVPTRTPQSASPTNTPASSPTTLAQEGKVVANAQHGQELFTSLGCSGCHGQQGEGKIGPTIAQTDLPLTRVIRQYRAPYQNMPRFGPDRVSESDIADIYAFLHTLPTPQARVPSVLANVTPEAGIGTVRGTILYSDTGKPAADEQIYILPAAENPDGSLAFSYLPHLPAGLTDSQGRFEIADVEAQLYAVFYSRQEAVVRDADGNIVLVNVLPGQVTETEGFILAP